MSRLEAFHMGPAGTGGPTTADEANNLANLTFGLLGRDQEVVKYSNPRLLGYLFPTLYPSGQGLFSMDYSGVKRGCNDEIEVFEVEDINYRNDQASVQDLSSLAEENSDGSTSDACSVDEPSDDQDQIENPEAEYEESNVDSDSSDNEERKVLMTNMADETDAQIQENSKYSKFTIKNYAKFRLLSMDRRWGRNIKFILMMFDWIQKSAIFAYQRRVARPTTGGRKTRADDVLNQSYRDGGTKCCESQTAAIPPFIRTGIKYKQALFQKFSALFEEFGNSELFGTFTCDDRSADQVAVARHFGDSGFGSGILSQALERAEKAGV
ncbi:hypothetical protein BGZ51_004206 [Haplosporangium sp. Z 767]|nr:hypothetical protein BGZ51_004206 [Haplosporangium sp. Z 767]